MEKIAAYFDQYMQIFFLSLIYFSATSFTGIFLILRRASLYGMVLSQIAQVSFLLGMAVAAYFKNHEHVFSMINRASSGASGDWHFLELDLFIFPVTFVLLLPVVWAAVRGVRSRETILVIGLLMFLAIYPLLNKISGGSDSVLAKAYFTEILYTPAVMFYHYLPFIGLLIVTLVIFSQRILLSGFDPVQAHLSGLRPGVYNALLFFLAGFILSVSVRILGAYVSMASLIVPGYISLQLARQMKNVILVTLLLAVFLPATGFMVAFHFDNWPTEPILTLYIIAGGSFILIVKKFVRIIHK